MQYKNKLKKGLKLNLKKLNLTLLPNENDQKKLKKIHDAGYTAYVSKSKTKKNEEDNDSDSDD